LIADLRHVATASGVVIGVAAASVPVIDGAALDVALEGGEEYELALTAPPGVDSDEFEARFGVPLTDIGTVLAADGDAGSVLIGERVASQSGYDHLSR
jgi:thiamine monophosphate kinase